LESASDDGTTKRRQANKRWFEEDHLAIVVER
jgi:hypothetical protein